MRNGRCESEIKIKNPFGPEQDPLAYYGSLKKRMLQHVQGAKVSDQILQVVQKAYKDAIRKENILLSPPAKQRMLSQILKYILDDMVRKLDKGTV